MDTTKMLAELHEERDHIDEAILVLSRLAAGAPKRVAVRTARAPEKIASIS
jgi:hypothetical protein